VTLREKQSEFLYCLARLMLAALVLVVGVLLGADPWGLFGDAMIALLTCAYLSILIGTALALVLP
jgi:hypothetical protein